MEPEHTLYVGDSYDNDIVGARNGGWHSLWFNHSRELPSCQPASHLAEVTCFTELCPTVEKLFIFKKPLFKLKNGFLFILFFRRKMMNRQIISKRINKPIKR